MFVEKIGWNRLDGVVRSHKIAYVVPDGGCHQLIDSFKNVLDSILQGSNNNEEKTKKAGKQEHRLHIS